MSTALTMRANGRADHERWRRSRIWPALAVGVLLHVILVMVPITRQVIDTMDGDGVDVELRWLPPTPEIIQAEPIVIDAAAASTPVITTQESPPKVVPAEPEVLPQLLPSPQTRLEDRALVRRILNARYYDSRSGEVRMQGYLTQESTAPVREFYFPAEPSMLDHLNSPIPELPFADPGWDVFMYSPGPEGRIHRYFDSITPEFGWTSKTGFKVRCRYLLVVIGCGWGR